MKGDLRKHILEAHDGKQEWRCDVCNSVWKRKENLRAHVAQVHEKNKPFKCSFCGYGAARKDSVKSHIACKHKGISVEILCAKTKNLNNNPGFRRDDETLRTSEPTFENVDSYDSSDHYFSPKKSEELRNSNNDYVIPFSRNNSSLHTFESTLEGDDDMDTEDHYSLENSEELHKSKDDSIVPFSDVNHSLHTSELFFDGFKSNLVEYKR